MEDRQKRDDEELQLSEMNALYAATQWTESDSMPPHRAGFVAGWIAAMRWEKLRKKILAHQL